MSHFAFSLHPGKASMQHVTARRSCRQRHRRMLHSSQADGKDQGAACALARKYSVRVSA
eukprot:CAMPEP_0185189528 /NCGR_PEP_ID=MMETSP1140-20130426/6099_1 /TAXON_ID=298111 /ORGANISM="Pavlova sp., Strain CCMP459" /LENGTH=58 /DNA_ID=CAMNT_0027756095 /DNA_START=35 /DNA_END=211 /DNA_ORIENTATION=-